MVSTIARDWLRWTLLDRGLQRQGMTEALRVLRVGAFVLAIPQGVAASLAPLLIVVIYLPGFCLAPDSLSLLFVGAGSLAGFWDGVLMTVFAGIGAFVATIAVGIVACRPGLK